jgi:plasmid stabilization system protein ParE
VTTTFSEEARLDIRKIGYWTYEQWGEAQVGVYNAHLAKLFIEIGKYPKSRTSRVLDPAKPEVRFRHIRSIFRRGRHFAFYRVTEDGVHILRVLHEKMLVEGRIG